MKMEPSLTNQMRLLVVGRGLAFAVSFAVPLVLVRVFSPELFGLYKQLFLIHGTCVSILTLGFSASLTYFVPCQPHFRDVYITQSIIVLGVSGIAGGVCLILFEDQVTGLMSNPALVTYLPYLAVFLTLTLVTSVLETIMVAIKQPHLAAWTFFGSELLRGVLTVVVALLTQSMIILMVGMVAWSVFRLVALMGYLRYLDIPLWKRPDITRLVEQFKYATPFGLALIVRAGADGLPQYVVSYLYNPALFAVFSVGYLQIPIVSILFESVSEVTLVKLAELRSKGMLPEALHIVGEAVNKLCLVLFPVHVWLMANSRDLIVLLFTEKFESSVEIFRIFLLSIPLTAVALDYVPRGFADVGFVLRVNVLRVILTAVLLLLLVPWLGMVGAALAAVFAIGVTKGVILLRVRSLFNSSLKAVLPWNRLARICAASFVAGVSSVASQFLAIPFVGLKLMFSAAVFAIVYGLFLWLGGMIDQEEKRKIVNWFQSVVGYANFLIKRTG